MSFNDPIDRIRTKIHKAAFGDPKFRDQKIEALLKQLLSYQRRIAEALKDLTTKDEQKVGMSFLSASDLCHYVTRNCPKSATFATGYLRRSPMEDWRQWFRALSSIIRSTKYIQGLQGDLGPQFVFEGDGAWAPVVAFLFEELRQLKYGNKGCIHQLVQDNEFASAYWRCRIYDELKSLKRVGGLGDKWLHGYQEALAQREDEEEEEAALKRKPSKVRKKPAA